MIAKRFWEIDFLRGLAIVLMVIFNHSFALNYLGVYSVNGGFLFWDVFPRFIAFMFITIAGVSSTLFYNQMKDKKKIVLRGLKIFGCGTLITIVTFLTFPQTFIIFGILHLIGFSIIASLFFLRFKKLNLVLGIAIILAGLILQNYVFNFPWLLWLGFTPSNFYTFDYFPILPWFGIFLIGMFVGNHLYEKGQRRFSIRDLSNKIVVKSFDFLGRHSLVIYLLHQPLLVLALLALGFKVF